MGMRRDSDLPAFASTGGYFDYVARGYDLISETYDEVEAANAVGRRIRARFQKALQRCFNPGDMVLEIGCGTGIEAISLAERGIRVIATDLSDKMVTRLKMKAEQSGLNGITARRLAAHEVGQLVAEYSEGAFDGVFSHGGVLNMDPNLPQTAEAIASLLRPEAVFLCSVVNQASLFEVLFYPLILKPRKAFRRLGNVVPIPITRLSEHSRYVVPTRFYSPRRFFQFFSHRFTLRHLEGLQILLPPWNLADQMDRVPPLRQVVEVVESLLADKPPFNAWGSLFMMELVRKHDS